jgi:hypothetical protein
MLPVEELSRTAPVENALGHELLADATAEDSATPIPLNVAEELRRGPAPSSSKATDLLNGGQAEPLGLSAKGLEELRCGEGISQSAMLRCGRDLEFLRQLLKTVSRYVREQNGRQLESVERNLLKGETLSLQEGQVKAYAVPEKGRRAYEALQRI